MVEEEDRSQDRDPHFVRACAVEMHFNMSQEPLYTEIYQKNAAPQKRDPHTLCEPAQSKCMSTFRKSHFIWRFTGKMLETRVSTLIRHRPLHTARTPQCGHTFWGKNK